MTLYHDDDGLYSNQACFRFKLYQFPLFNHVYLFKYLLLSCPLIEKEIDAFSSF